MDKPKTVRVRVLVVVDEKGDWSAAGICRHTDNEMMAGALDFSGLTNPALHWIEADVPVPEVTTIAGSLTP